MGRMKHYSQEMTEGGMNLRVVEDMFVCKKCVDDPALQKWLIGNYAEHKCSYCSKTYRKLTAASMVDLVRHVVRGLEKEYDDAENGLGRDSESETGWDGEVYQTYELLEAELDIGNTESLFFSDLCSAVGDRTWSAEDPYGPREHELLSWSWNAFRKMALHKNRFFYVEAARRARKQNDETPGIDETLAAFLGYCERNELYVIEPKGIKFYRCQPKQLHEKHPFDPGRMGPPPDHLARQANRMSPAGIPRFYGAEKPETALSETMDKAGRAAVGCFSLRAPLRFSISHVVRRNRVYSTQKNYKTDHGQYFYESF